MSDLFRDKEGRLIYIKENPFTGEVIDNDKTVEFQQKAQFSNKYIESWCFVVREYTSCGGGVRSLLENKEHFDSENKATNYLYNNGWVRGNSSSDFIRNTIKDGWDASKRATITCEKIKLINNQ